MFSKVLIANRGEIALRIIRACRELGLRTVAVYSEADRASLPVRIADEAFCIGPAPARDSYLNIPSIISTAELLGVDAIHPGYGFLAENPHFAEICRDCRITFIGPTPEAIAKMGNKSAAREMMRKAGVPIVPGSDGPVHDEAAAIAVARGIGYPLIVKAAGGGGGRGMRVVQNREDLLGALTEAQREAEAAFGNAEVYIEKYLEEPRHIEIQILAEALSYTNAGTVEFLVDQSERFYFVEMNTRIQVEHGVTEMVTGVDLVKEQIRIAAGERMTAPREGEPRGHAIECRVNAEDPSRDFLPAPGSITAFVPPGGPGIRVDTHAFAGYLIPAHYDSLIAKVIAWGLDRDEAVARMQRALQEFEVKGVPTTIPFHQQALDNAFFRRGEIYVNFIQRRMDLSTLRA